MGSSYCQTVIYNDDSHTPPKKPIIVAQVAERDLFEEEREREAEREGRSLEPETPEWEAQRRQEDEQHEFLKRALRAYEAAQAGIPQKAVETLDYVEANGGATKQGYVGGRTFKK